MKSYLNFFSSQFVNVFKLVDKFVAVVVSPHHRWLPRHQAPSDELSLTVLTLRLDVEAEVRLCDDAENLGRGLGHVNTLSGERIGFKLELVPQILELAALRDQLQPLQTSD